MPLRSHIQPHRRRCSQRAPSVCACVSVRVWQSTKRAVAAGLLEPLTLHSMRDIDDMTSDIIGELHYRPHEITGASGRKYVALLCDVGAIVKLWFEDPLTHAMQQIEAQLEPLGVDPDDDDRQFSSVLAADWIREMLAKHDQIAPDVIAYVLSLFDDGTVRSSTGAKYSPLMLFNNHLPLHLRFKRENILIYGLAPIVPSEPVVEGANSETPQSPGDLKRAAKKERRSVSDAVMQLISSNFASHRAGVDVVDPYAPDRTLVSRARP